MFTENVVITIRRRGRPQGPTQRGIEARERLYREALALMAERGFEASTMRDVARRAKVSAGLLYRYFPSKRAVVLELYDELSREYAREGSRMPRGRWPRRFLFALNTSLATLAPHRKVLSALVPILVGDPAEGLFAARTAFSRERVQAVFEEAVTGASDAPSKEFGPALGRLLYLLHLVVILWWLLDKSPKQGATEGLIRLIERATPRIATALRLPFVRSLVRYGDDLFRQALFAET